MDFVSDPGAEIFCGDDDDEAMEALMTCWRV